MFYKIHYQLVPICMPLTPKLHLQPIRTENTIAYMIPSSVCDYHLQSFYPSTARDWNKLCHRKLLKWALSRPSDVPFSSTKDYVWMLHAHVCRQLQFLTGTCLFNCLHCYSTLLQLRSGFSALRKCTTSHALDRVFSLLKFVYVLSSRREEKNAMRARATLKMPENGDISCTRKIIIIMFILRASVVDLWA